MLSPLLPSVSVVCYLKQKVHNLEPEGTWLRTDPSITTFFFLFFFFLKSEASNPESHLVQSVS